MGNLPFQPYHLGDPIMVRGDPGKRVMPSPLPCPHRHLLPGHWQLQRRNIWPAHCWPPLVPQGPWPRPWGLPEPPLRRMCQFWGLGPQHCRSSSHTSQSEDQAPRGHSLRGSLAIPPLPHVQPSWVLSFPCWPLCQLRGETKGRCHLKEPQVHQRHWSSRPGGGRQHPSEPLEQQSRQW